MRRTPILAKSVKLVKIEKKEKPVNFQNLKTLI